MTDPDRIEGFALVDRHRSADLDDVGGQGLILATAVDSDGTEHLGVIERAALGERQQGFAMGSPEHEEVGPLPLSVSKRIAVVQRTHRCGRPTESGRPCRITVAHPGGACHWHTDANE